LRILHVLRAPIGGLMRHVADLIAVQAAMGHEVGLACGSGAGGVESSLASIAGQCRLGIARFPIPRLPGAGDVIAFRRFRSRVENIAPDIVHGHGAKGGLLARLSAGKRGACAVYTPHGGSLHHDRSSPAAITYLAAERWLRGRTAGLLFVCEWERRCYDARIGLADVANRVVYNGLKDDDFLSPSAAPDIDVLFVGELRQLKNVDVLLRAIAMLKPTLKVTTTILGDGPSRPALEELAAALGISDHVTFAGQGTARDFLGRSRLLAVPSQREAFPYVVLEGLAAGLPVIASRVGGIPEMLPRDCLVEPGDFSALARKIAETLNDISDRRLKAASRVADARARFSVRRMGDDITSFYQEILRRRGPILT
jgi:glycosyltransferase involved in cell wall biosynthesis